MKFKEGDVVYYISGVHTLGKANPLKGTEFECIGVVKSVPPTYSLIVRWDNGSSNVYSENDLEKVEAQLQNNNPNSIFRRK